MAINPRWQRNGYISTYKATAKGLQLVTTPVREWLQSRVGSIRQTPTVTQSGPSGGATAVGPTGDGVPIHHGAQLHCTYGLAPGVLVVIPPTRPANVNDGRGTVNVTSCGLCMSLTNPTVAAATAANHGVMTPMPCAPATLRWGGGSSTQVSDGAPALHPGSTIRCALGGTISIVSTP